VRIENLASTNVRIGAFVSFDADGFTINWTTADAVAPIFHYLALNGVTATLAYAAIAMQPSNQSPALTVVPRALFLLDNLPDSDDCNLPSIGWATTLSDGTPNGQGACTVNVEDAQTTSDTHRIQQADRCAAIMSGTGVFFHDLAQSYSGVAGYSGSDASGTLGMLGLTGIAAKAGALNQPTSTGTQAITGLDFTPKVVILMSVGNTTQAGSQAQARFSFGAGDGTNMGRSWIGGEDAVNPSQTAKGHSTSVILSAVATVNATGGSNTAAAECTLDSLDADGFTLDWTVADATAREVLWLALGDDIGGGGGETASGHFG
jgi:hypothetical protein